MKEKLKIVLMLSIFGAMINANWLQAQLADSPWPMFRHDAQHTGRSPYVGPANPYVIWTAGSVYGGIPRKQGIAIGPDGRIVIHKKILAPNGTIIKEVESIQNSSTAAIDAEETIYSVGWKGVYAFDFEGNKKWFYPDVEEDMTFEITSPVIGPDSTIYCVQTEASGGIYGNFAAKLLAIDHSSGKLKWHFSIPNASVVTSPAIGYDGLIYIADKKLNLYAINKSGAKIWSVKLGEELNKLYWDFMTSPAIGVDGTVYIAEGGGRYLYAADDQVRLRRTPVGA